MSQFVPDLPETRIVPFTRIRRERRLPARGEVAATIDSKLDPLDVIARATPPKARRALSLTRVLGVREADVPKRLRHQAGDNVENREIIIGRPINFGLRQLVYRAPGPGKIVAIQGSWMLFDIDGSPVDLNALYRGTVVNVTPRLGAEIEGQGALIQCAWGSGKEGYGVLKLMATNPHDVLEADSIEMDARGTILVAGAGVTREALRRAESLSVQGLVVGSLEASLRAEAESLQVPVMVTEGFGRIPMAAPIFDLLSTFNGQEAAINGVTQLRGQVTRPEIFVPLVAGRFADLGSPVELKPLESGPGARVRVIRQPHLGRVGKLLGDSTKWLTTEAGAQFAGAEIEFEDTPGDRVVIPWTNLELIG